jgi:uncharacterized protein YkwD
MEMLNEFIAFFPSLLRGFNLLDVIILCIVLFYVHEGYTLGFTMAFLDLMSFIVSFVAALQFYTNVASLLTLLFALPIGIANALSFFLIALISEIILTLLVRRGMRYLPGLPHGRFTQWLKDANHWLGIIPGMVSAFIILSFLLTIIVTFPSSPVIKNAVNTSSVGSRLVANTSLFEKQLNTLFGGALNDTISFLTVEPKSDETIQLHFKVESGSVDAQAEQEMFKLVNTERTKQGLPPVAFDIKLRDVARAHSDDMFTRGYFSHKTPEGLSPFDRMDDAGVTYQYAGENLALAPSTALAMQGLMNSPGHRANILGTHFKKIGIGVIDGGIYGKMYSQEFSD